jgi:predicted metallopeptidase
MNIELTEEEIKAIITELYEIPYKYSSTLVGFLSKKLSDHKKIIAKQQEANNS